jgi:hypothetical protein
MDRRQRSQLVSGISDLSIIGWDFMQLAMALPAMVIQAAVPDVRLNSYTIS